MHSLPPEILLVLIYFGTRLGEGALGAAGGTAFNELRKHIAHLRGWLFDNGIKIPDESMVKYGDFQIRARAIRTILDDHKSSYDLAELLEKLETELTRALSDNQDLPFLLLRYYPLHALAISYSLIDTVRGDFYGRRWLLADIDDWLKDRRFSSGYLIIPGEAGVGKTWLAAKLVDKYKCMHHFNSLKEGITSLHDFLSNICAQVIIRYRLPENEIPSDARLNTPYLVKLLSEAAKTSDTAILIVIDALDEHIAACTLGGHTPLLNNPLSLPEQLPHNVRFVVTTRPLKQTCSATGLLTKPPPLVFGDIDSDRRNVDDLRLYIEHSVRVKPPLHNCIESATIRPEDFVDILTQKADGNFMYAANILREIESGGMPLTSIRDIRSLPQGLVEYYEWNWQRLISATGDALDSVAGGLLQTLAVISRPLSIEELVSYTNMRQYDVLRALDRVSVFINRSGEEGTCKYALYHESFREFICTTKGIQDARLRIIEQCLDNGNATR